MWVYPRKKLRKMFSYIMTLYTLSVKKSWSKPTKFLASDQNFGRLNSKPTIFKATKIFTDYLFHNCKNGNYSKKAS